MEIEWGEYNMVDKEEFIEDLEEILRGFKETLANPKNSGKAGEIYILLKRLNKELDKV